MLCEVSVSVCVYERENMVTAFNNLSIHPPNSVTNVDILYNCKICVDLDFFKLSSPLLYLRILRMNTWELMLISQ